VLFYPLGGYGGDGYQTSYATSTALTGPYTKAYRSLVTTARPSAVGSTAARCGPPARVAGPGGRLHRLRVQLVDETWRQVRADVTLTAGVNTVRLTHRSRWAELDFLEVA
jgi:hypothetical protein